MRLNRTDDLLTDVDYPVTSDDLIDRHGEQTIELANGTETLGAVLARTGPETYENSGDVQEALLTGVSHDAVGRRFYSDRDPASLADAGPEQLSF